jgi:hypothetical protein
MRARARIVTLALQPAQVRVRCLRAGKNRDSVTEDDPPRLRQGGAPDARSALDELRIEQPLERRQLLADSRLAVTEKARRRSQRALVSNRSQRNEMTQLDRSPSNRFSYISVRERTFHVAARLGIPWGQRAGSGGTDGQVLSFVTCLRSSPPRKSRPSMRQARDWGTRNPPSAARSLRSSGSSARSSSTGRAPVALHDSPRPARSLRDLRA